MNGLKNICEISELCTKNKNLNAEAQKYLEAMAKKDAFTFMLPIVNHMYFTKMPYIFLTTLHHRNLLKSYNSANNTKYKQIREPLEKHVAYFEKNKTLTKIYPRYHSRRSLCFRLPKEFSIVEDQEKIISEKRLEIEAEAQPFLNRESRPVPCGDPFTKGRDLVYQSIQTLLPLSKGSGKDSEKLREIITNLLKTISDINDLKKS